MHILYTLPSVNEMNILLANLSFAEWNYRAFIYMKPSDILCIYKQAP